MEIEEMSLMCFKATDKIEDVVMQSVTGIKDWLFIAPFNWIALWVSADISTSVSSSISYEKTGSSAQNKSDPNKPPLPLSLCLSLSGIMLLLLCFFAFLHCWLNLFGELLRFADRMFYKVCVVADSEWH